MIADNKSGLNCSTQENSQSVSATSSFFLFLPGLLDPTANQGPLPCCLRLHLLQLLLLFPLLGLECLGRNSLILVATSRDLQPYLIVVVEVAPLLLRGLQWLLLASFASGHGGW